MKEVGMLNGAIDSALTRQGHMDLMMVVDAGFWPKGSLADGVLVSK